ncbi:MAG: hypothetical protein RLZZ519_852 [Bacteroidota bacterium]|jgi:transcriptional regulator with XRE-family HTH domain
MTKKEKGSSSIIRKFLARIPAWTRIKVGRNMEIAIYVKEILDQKGWNQRDLAEKLGKRESEISRLLSGDHNMTLETIAKYEAALETPLLQVPKFAESVEISKTYQDSRLIQEINTTLEKNPWPWHNLDPNRPVQSRGIPISYPQA